MAAPYKASVVLATSNTAILPASLCNDLLILVSNSNQGMSFGASNVATWLRISSNGFVGVGKSNPGYTLDIAGNINFAGTLTSNGIPFVSGGGAFSNNGSNLYVLAPSNIGIHVSTPLAALHVASNARIDGDLTLMRNIQFGGVYVTPGGTTTNASQLVLATSNIQGYSNLVWGAASNGTQYSIMSNTSNDVFRWVSGSASNEVMRLTGDGRLGIGSVAPSSTVHLGTAFASNVMVTLCNVATGGRPALVGLSNSGDVVLATASNHSLLFVTSNSERMRITSNGLIGIGTSAPAYTLDVNGYTRTKTVAFLAYCYGGPTVANAAGWFLVPMNNATYNYNATLSIPYSGSQPGNIGCPWTVTVAGVYDIKIKVTCGTGGWTTQNVGYSVNNASSVGVQSSVYVGSSVGSFTQVFNVNDVVRVWYYQSGGSGYMNSWGDSTTTFFACTLLAAL